MTAAFRRPSLAAHEQRGPSCRSTCIRLEITARSGESRSEVPVGEQAEVETRGVKSDTWGPSVMQDNLSNLHHRLMQDVLEIGNSLPPVITVPSQPSRRLGPGNRHVSETLSPGSVSAIMSFPGRPQVSALCRCLRSWRRRLGGRPAGQRVDLLPLLPRRDRPVATRAAGPASEGSSCNCIGNAGRTVRGGGALPAAQLRCLGVTHEMLVAPAEQVWDDPVFRSHRD